MRLVDLKTKMGVVGRRWQMRTLAKSCRTFAAMGVLKYVAAVMRDDRRVFRDCIKYVREPTKDEWASFLACGKKTACHSDQIVDWQLKRPLHVSRRSAPQNPRDPAFDDDDDGDDAEDEESSLSLLVKSSWIPEKPLANILFETIRRTGPEGITNPQLSRATIGFAFRRSLFSRLQRAIGVQPPHLSHLRLTSTRRR